jgi:putative spermidine/putrescine transport system permease protein
VIALTAFIAGPFVVLALWSVAKQWFWPSLLPPQLTLEWYRWAGNVPGVMHALQMSLLVASLTTMLTTAVALPAAIALGRARFSGADAVRSLLALPFMVPYIALGVGITQLFRQIGLLNSIPGLVLAHTVGALPFGVLVLTSACKDLSREVEEAAYACGASRWQTISRVVLPLLAPALLAQAIYVFTLSMDEFTLTLLVSGPDTITLPVRIYTSIGEGFIQLTSALSMLLLVPSVLLIYVMIKKLDIRTLSAGGG